MLTQTIVFGAVFEAPDSTHAFSTPPLASGSVVNTTLVQFGNIYEE